MSWFERAAIVYAVLLIIVAALYFVHSALSKVCHEAQSLPIFHNLVRTTRNSQLSNFGKPLDILLILKPKIKNNKFIDKLRINNNISSNTENIANHFNDYFCSIGINLANKIPSVPNLNHKHYMSQPNIHSLFTNPVNDHEIIKIINSLKNGKSVGDEDIPVKLLKSCKYLLSKPICILANLSLETGIFPDKLKIARVVPLYKKEDPLLCDNYRPISILGTISKILEKVMLNRINSFLEKYNILYKLQFGFRKKHSTKIALIDLLEKINLALDSGQNVLGIYIDLKKSV